jgi:hypothetical protein
MYLRRMNAGKVILVVCEKVILGHTYIRENKDQRLAVSSRHRPDDCDALLLAVRARRLRAVATMTAAAQSATRSMHGAPARRHDPTTAPQEITQTNTTSTHCKLIRVEWSAKDSNSKDSHANSSANKSNNARNSDPKVQARLTQTRPH